MLRPRACSDALVKRVRGEVRPPATSRCGSRRRPGPSRSSGVRGHQRRGRASAQYGDLSLCPVSEGERKHTVADGVSFGYVGCQADHRSGSTGWRSFSTGARAAPVLGELFAFTPASNPPRTEQNWCRPVCLVTTPRRDCRGGGRTHISWNDAAGGRAGLAPSPEGGRRGGHGRFHVDVRGRAQERETPPRLQAHRYTVLRAGRSSPFAASTVCASAGTTFSPWAN